MHPTCTLSKEDTGTKLDQNLFRGMIGSLLYLTATRPGILFSICLCARFQSGPREYHLTAVKRIFRYLKGTTNLGLVYKKSLDYNKLDFVMLIMLVIRLKENQSMETVSFLVRI